MPEPTDAQQFAELRGKNAALQVKVSQLESENAALKAGNPGWVAGTKDLLTWVWGYRHDVLMAAIVGYATVAAYTRGETPPAQPAPQVDHAKVAADTTAAVIEQLMKTKLPSKE